MAIKCVRLPLSSYLNRLKCHPMRVGISKINNPSNLTILTTWVHGWTILEKKVDWWEGILVVFDGKIGKIAS